jgi:hypothetical protein
MFFPSQTSLPDDTNNTKTKTKRGEKRLAPLIDKIKQRFEGRSGSGSGPHEHGHEVRPKPGVLPEEARRPFLRRDGVQEWEKSVERKRGRKWFGKSGKGGGTQSAETARERSGAADADSVPRNSDSREYTSFHGDRESESAATVSIEETTSIPSSPSPLSTPKLQAHHLQSYTEHHTGDSPTPSTKYRNAFPPLPKKPPDLKGKLLLVQIALVRCALLALPVLDTEIGTNRTPEAHWRRIRDVVNNVGLPAVASIERAKKGDGSGVVLHPVLRKMGNVGGDVNEAGMDRYKALCYYWLDCAEMGLRNWESAERALGEAERVEKYLEDGVRGDVFLRLGRLREGRAAGSEDEKTESEDGLSFVSAVG